MEFDSAWRSEKETRLRMAMATSHVDEMASAFASAFLLLAWTAGARLA